MSGIWAIFRKELKTFFVSPIAYVAVFIFIFLTGWMFRAIAFQSWPQGEGHLRYLYGNMAITFLFVIPLITMRIFAEEKASGTIELLMTSPVREREVVLGKYLACCALCLLIVVLSFQYAFFLLRYGKPDVGPIFTGYLGLFLVAISFVAIGVFMSTLTRNQIVAAALTFGTLLLFWIMSWGARTGDTGTFSEVLKYLCLYNHLQFESDLAKGLLDTRDLVYFLSFTFIWLFLAVRSLASSRWR